MDCKAFTLLELLIVIAIAVIIAGGLVPLFSVTKQDAKVAKALSMADALKDACMRYYFDTGQLAREFGIILVSDPAQDRQLSFDPGISGWSGPYISHALEMSDNPFDSGGAFGLEAFGVYRENSIIFDFDGNGSDDNQSGNYCNHFSFNVNSEATAKKINDALDRGIAGNWMTTGKVEYDSVTGVCRIYLFSARLQ